jgi:hypothetical protein
MSPVSFVKRHWPLFLAPIDSERDPGFYDEILRWNRIGLRVLAALAIVGTLLELVITVVVSGWNATWSMVHSRSYLVTDMITVALGTTSLISSFFPVGLKHGRLLVSMIALMSLLIRITETFASYEPAMFLAIPLNITLLMFIATGIAPYRFWHAAALGAAFYFVALLGYRHIAPLFELGLETPPQAISFVIILTFFCVGISELKYRAHYSIYRSKEEIRHYAEVLEKANRELHKPRSGWCNRRRWQLSEGWPPAWRTS